MGDPDEKPSGDGGAGDFDLELLETRTLDGHTQEPVYRPTSR